MSVSPRGLKAGSAIVNARGRIAARAASAFTMGRGAPLATPLHGTKSDFVRFMATERLKLSRGGRLGTLKDAT